VRALRPSRGGCGSNPQGSTIQKQTVSTKRLWQVAIGAFLLLAAAIGWPLPFIALATIAQAGMTAYFVYRLKGVDLFKLYVDWFTAAKVRTEEPDTVPWGHA
jgi:hypothetical protein